MNIKRAKEEIKNTVKVYLAKDEFGSYRIPIEAQRPVLLMGPPGIGKTAIMHQIANDLQIGLISYTITHHTRQSAVGLPFIEKKLFAGKEYSVTEYTMSEIIASVYEVMEQTGKKEGILFIDEINCVSETLAATMLQFLQKKSFGNHKVPQGWVIIAAGNPPEYNKSVKDYDLVTLDRMRRLDITPDYGVWKEYAYKNSIHGAILTYLDMKEESFYAIETTVDGVEFVTARGWEDLSKILKMYEEMNLKIEESLVFQYLQHRKIAKDFTNFFEFYQRYQQENQLVKLLTHHISDHLLEQISKANFDERLTFIGIVLDQLFGEFKKISAYRNYVNELYHVLSNVKVKLKIESEQTESILNVNDVLHTCISSYQAVVIQEKNQGILENDAEMVRNRTLQTLEDYTKSIRNLQINDSNKAFDYMKHEFEVVIEERNSKIKELQEHLQNAFIVVKKCFSINQEMVIFLTELTMNPYSSEFLSEYECEEYEKLCSELLFQNREDSIRKRIQELSILD